MVKKLAHDIVQEAYYKLVELNPTIEEIAEFAKNADWGTITYSISRPGGDVYFLRYHDTWGLKIGGRVHVDVGYVDQEIKAKNDSRQQHGYYRNICDTTHLMLDKDAAPQFIEFILQKRQKTEGVKIA